MSRPDAVSSYWLISVPNEEDEQKTRAKLKNKIANPQNPFSSIYSFPIPSLKVGTLDTLYTLSDELGKIDTYVEGVVKKIERSAFDVWRSEPHQEGKEGGGKDKDGKDNYNKDNKENNTLELKVSDRQLTTESYLENFNWDGIRYHQKKSD